MKFPIALLTELAAENPSPVAMDFSQIEIESDEDLSKYAAIRVCVNDIIGFDHWGGDYRQVFEYQGKFYETEYTWIHDDGPYLEEDPSGELECKEVFPKQVTMTVYE